MLLNKEFAAKEKLEIVQSERVASAGGKEGRKMELLAIDAGINRIAIQSDAAIEHAQSYGLEIKYQKTCCSIAFLDEQKIGLRGR